MYTGSMRFAHTQLNQSLSVIIQTFKFQMRNEHSIFKTGFWSEFSPNLLSRRILRVKDQEGKRIRNVRLP
jgi:hypothetical protein